MKSVKITIKQIDEIVELLQPFTASQDADGDEDNNDGVIEAIEILENLKKQKQ